MVLLLVHTSNIIYACGLFAFIGNNPTKYFSWDKFNTLGLFNDTRGGDACGRITGNRVMWGVDKLKKYADFAAEVSPYPLHVKSNVVLGHCRKASSGGKVDIYAQPVVLFKKDLIMSKIKDAKMIQALESVKDNDIVFSGIHNGTIENYLELADKYEIPTENHNDSRVLLSILFYGNYDVLKEYIGTAALIWHNHTLNKTYMFKGESKTWSTVGSTYEERPLYAWVIDKNNYYISSIAESLRFIQTKKAEIIDIKSNTLYKFTDGINNRSVKYDRSSCTQNKVYKSDYNYPIKSDYYKGGCNFRREAKMALRDYNNENYDAWGEDLPWEQKKLTYKIGDRHIRQFSINNQEGFRIAFEKNNTYVSRSLKKALYNKTRYWMNGGLMHGVYVLSQGGIVPVNSYTKGMVILKPYYFVEGIMMDGVQAYRAALRVHKEFMEDITDIMLDNQFLEEQFTFNIAKYSRFPVVPLLNNSSSECCFSPANLGPDPLKNRYSGEYQPLFSFMKYTFDRGELTSIVESKTQKIAAHDMSDDHNTKLYLDTVMATSPMDLVFSVGNNLLNFDNYKNPLSPFQQYLIDNYDIYGSTKLDEEGIFLINYLKDFSEDMIDDCKTCISNDTIFISHCHHCVKLKTNFCLLRNKKLYGIYD